MILENGFNCTPIGNLNSFVAEPNYEVYTGNTPPQKNVVLTSRAKHTNFSSSAE